jgi:sugar phosphate isomerase/epimerase
LEGGLEATRSAYFRNDYEANPVHEANLRFATRLNSFGSKPDAYWPKGRGKPSSLELAERASKVEGLTDVDLNYPDHVGPDPRVTGDAIRDLGLAVNGLAMRYYSNPAFKIGAFTNPDPAVRREAIDLTKRGIDAARQAGCNLMTLWLGQDGFDYAFQADYWPCDQSRAGSNCLANCVAGGVLQRAPQPN